MKNLPYGGVKASCIKYRFLRPPVPLRRPHSKPHPPFGMTQYGWAEAQSPPTYPPTSKTHKHEKNLKPHSILPRTQNTELFTHITSAQNDSTYRVRVQRRGIIPPHNHSIARTTRLCRITARRHATRRSHSIWIIGGIGTEAEAVTAATCVAVG
jgi:hypothetical protein